MHEIIRGLRVLLLCILIVFELFIFQTIEKVSNFYVFAGGCTNDPSTFNCSSCDRISCSNTNAGAVACQADGYDYYCSCLNAFPGEVCQPSGGSVCTGCYPGSYPQGMYSVTGSTATQVNSTSATVNWTYGDGSGCGKRGTVKIFVGRSQDVVNASCGWDGSYYATPMTNPYDINGSRGTGGLGGGGDGAFFSPNNVGNGVNGTGGGGGGAFGNPNGLGGSGGSGVVIVRYPTGSVIATGGTMTFSGGDTIHTFTSSGTFAISAGSTNNARVLVVGGGAAGGCYYKGAGGGGAGGVIQQNNVSLNPGTYPVTVGAGGTGCPLHLSITKDPNDRTAHASCNVSGTGQGGHGGNSSILNYTAIGGGGGGSYFIAYTGINAWCTAKAKTDGAAGGSGGGAHYFGGVGGAGTTGQGNNGGAGGGAAGPAGGAGGGGGAGAPGANGQTSYSGGVGGDGVASDISGATQYYGGGGGGGTGGFLPAGCFKFLTVANSVTSATITGLAPNTTYYFKVVPEYFYTNNTTGEDIYQICGSSPAVPNLACSVSINPSSSIIPEGGTGQFTTSVNGLSGTNTVKYSPTNSPYFSFNPSEVTSDVSTGFPTDVTGVAQSPPNQQITAGVYANPTDAIPACTGVGTLTVGTPVNSWWQVKDSDVQSDNGLQSLVPTGNYFGLPGQGGYPGVPAYQNSVNFGNGSASQLGWLAESPWSNAKQFDYAFFSNLIPSDTQITAIDNGDLTGATPDANGYEWYQYTSVLSQGGVSLNIDAPIDIGSRKIILLVKGADLNINAPINGITKGSGFFMAIVNGNINVAPTVGGSAAYDLEGLYVADNYFSTGTNGDTTPSDLPLRVRGSIVGYAGVQLQRKINTLDSSSTPSEFFEYAPDQMLLYPSVLGYRKINWREVAP